MFIFIKKSCALFISMVMLLTLTVPGFSASSAIASQVTENVLTSRISAGGGHSLAVHSDGTVWAWGDNTAGQLGLET